jgi:hypothetical protein
MFKMYAVKLFLEKILLSYKEKIALEMQNLLIYEEAKEVEEKKKKRLNFILI